MPLLEVNNLRIRLQTHRGPATAVRDVSFSLERGHTLGLIGESGCGKSITALSLMGLLPERAQVSGSVRFDGRELTGADEKIWCDLRGNRVSMVFQEPMTSLNPVHTIGHQVAEPLRLHKGLSARQAREEALALLSRVGIPDPIKRIDAYPHQFSGGQRQRITIAMAHDLGVIAQNVQRMLVMYGGSVVESGATHSVFSRMAHPYTQGLFAARPRLGQRDTNGRPPRLSTIVGTVPELADLPSGCSFFGRCPIGIEACAQTVPAPVELDGKHVVRCIRTGENP